MALATFGSTAAADTLSAEAESAVLTALMDEYRAAVLYDALITEFGPTTTLVNIQAAEVTHAAALISVLERYGVEVPDNPYLTGEAELGELPDSLTEAYVAGIHGEIENIALYDTELLPVVADYPDIVNVFTNLRNASANNHLPAFTRSAESAGRMGSGARTVSASANRGGGDATRQGERTGGGQGGDTAQAERGGQGNGSAGQGGGNRGGQENGGGNRDGNGNRGGNN